MVGTAQPLLPSHSAPVVSGAVCARELVEGTSSFHEKRDPRRGEYGLPIGCGFWFIRPAWVIFKALAVHARGGATVGTRRHSMEGW
jgi:hypothetical protein